MLGSAVFYIGVVATLGGLLGVIRPLQWTRLRTRRRGAVVAAIGGALVIVATLIPDRTRATTTRDLLIDQWLPEWQFGEYHERRVQATPAQVFAAIRRVRSSDIFLFRTLTYLRNPIRGRQGEHILNPPEEKPILEVALAGGFVVLSEAADRELLLGLLVVAPPGAVRAANRGNLPSLDPALFRTLRQPGYVRAVMNFRAVPEPDGWTRVTTETRVHAVDRPSRRAFARYWRVIYPGSWIIRWSWLRAIEARLLS